MIFAAAISRRRRKRSVRLPMQMPNEPRIAFDRGCAFAAQGENDKAVEQFRIAAASKNRPLAATAHYNLGCLAIAKAKTKFGEKPEEAKPEVRPEGLESLDEASGHLRDCPCDRPPPEHADARYNLETVRLWTRHIQKAWRQRDLQKRRLDMNLLQFLQWMEKEQRELRTNQRSLASEPASPRRREAIRAIENTQTELADEITPLKEKIHAALFPSAAAPTTAGGPTGGPATQPATTATPQPANPEAEKALTVLNGLADEAGVAMKTAADALAAAKPADAIKPQAEAIEKIDSIFMLVSPFVELVKKGIATEEGLIGKSKEATGGEKNGVKSENGEKSDKPREAVGLVPRVANGEKAEKNGNGEPDWAEAAWEQRVY